MNHWFSPLIISPEVEVELDQIGIRRWPNEAGEPTESCLLLYDSLDRIVSAAVETNQSFTTDDVIYGLSILSKIANSKKLILLAGWRILALGNVGLRQWLDGHSLDPVDSHPGCKEEVIACVTYSLIESREQLVSAYNALELQAELLGSEPHLNYKRDLQRLIGRDDPLPSIIEVLKYWREVNTLSGHKSKIDELERKLITCHQDLNESRIEVGIATRSLNSLQAQLEKHFIAEKCKKDLLEAKELQLSDSKTQVNELQMIPDECTEKFAVQIKNLNLELLASRENAHQCMQQIALIEEESLHQKEVHKQTLSLVDERTHELAAARAEIRALKLIHQETVDLLKEKISFRDREISQSVEAVEIIRVRLEDVQKKLEEYFIKCRQSRNLIESQSHALVRSKILLARLLSEPRHQREEAVDVQVEVMPFQSHSSFATGVQEQALIESYSKSLDRALSLLKMAVNF